MPEDEDDLVQRLGLTARNVRVRNLSIVVSFIEYFLDRSSFNFLSELRTDSA